MRFAFCVLATNCKRRGAMRVACNASPTPEKLTTVRTMFRNQADLVIAPDRGFGNEAASLNWPGLGSRASAARTDTQAVVG